MIEPRDEQAQKRQCSDEAYALLLSKIPRILTASRRGPCRRWIHTEQG